MDSLCGYASFSLSFRYRTEQLGVDPSRAKLDLNQIWEPFDYWRPFMSGDLID